MLFVLKQLSYIISIR